MLLGLTVPSKPISNPQSYGAVVGAGSDDVIVEWVPFDIQNWPGMSGDPARVEVQSPGLKDGSREPLITFT